MIISASRRTDIPAHYSKWLINRFIEGYVYVRNPMNFHMVSRISLKPSTVDCVVFWTKNATPLINYIDQFSNYHYYFQYTINNLPKIFEPNIPNLYTTINTFKSLSTSNGRKRIIWRYDPIILTEEINFDWHKKNFQFLCENLSNYTNKCVISFVDYYKNTKKNMRYQSYKEISAEQIIELAYSLRKIADNYDIRLESCAGKIDLESIGIKHGKCIDDKLIEEIIESPIKIEKDKFQRLECGCVASIDIGAYNSCINGCIYCYANANVGLANKNYLSHDPDSPLLFGNTMVEDKIFDRECISCKVLQSKFF